MDRTPPHKKKTKNKSDNLFQQDLLAVALRSSSIVIPSHPLVMFDHLLRWFHYLRPPTPVSCIIILQMLLCRVMWPNNAIFRSLIVARRNYCRSNRLL